MKRVALIAALACAGVARADEQRIGEHTFTLPEGFSIERVAAAPLVDRPIACAFDERGRLYVTDSSGNSERAHEQLEKKPHRVRRLVDENGDGVFDSSTLFADRMMFPEGILWHRGSVYVGAPPSIWKLTDRDDDGIADIREEWFNGQTLTGCANDLHGPYLGPDGYLYWCKGAFAEQTYARAGRKPFVTRAAHVFRRHPDGGEIEPVMTGGMDNPVDVTFSREGERFITTTFFQHPGGGRRDGLIHILYGGVYGKRHDVLDDHPWTGGLMPVLTHLGAAAPCGLTRYRSDVFGVPFEGNLFATLFNMHKVTRHELAPDGASYRSVDTDFLSSDNRDFHPTDIVEGADGSLLVVDTGGWYKVCCPTSQLGKPDVLGAIYRVRRDDATPLADARGAKLDWSPGVTPVELAARLDDARPAVRERARGALAERGSESVAPLVAILGDTSSSGAARRGAVWTLVRIDGERARAATRIALRDRSESVRHAGCHAVALRRDRGAADELLSLVADGDGRPAVRRAAAEALGRLGDVAAVPVLLAACGNVTDRALEHSLIYACIEIGDPNALREGLHSKSVGTRRAALIASSEMRASLLEPRQVARYLESEIPAIRETALWIVGRHPNWGGALRGYFQTSLAGLEGENASLENLLATFARRDPSIAQLLSSVLGREGLGIAPRRAALRAMRRSGLKKAPASWTSALTSAAGEPELFDDVLETTSRVELSGDVKALSARFAGLAADSMRKAATRLAALAAMPDQPSGLSPELFALVLERLTPNAAVLERRAAVHAVVRARLSPEQKNALVAAVDAMGPFVINDIFPAFETLDDALAESLLARLADAPSLTSLRGEVLSKWLAGRSPKVRSRGEALLAELDGDPAERQAKLEALLIEITKAGGDVRRGQLVFNSPKAACRTCHEIGYLGGNVGPDLTNIGKTRSVRDLLESIVFPSITFVRSYEPTLVLTKRGDAWTGILKSNSPEEVVLVAGPDKTYRIARVDIREMRPARTSVMPSGLDTQMSTRELADLIAFLRGARW